MKKEEILKLLKQFIIDNKEDKRLIDSMKKAIAKLFETKTKGIKFNDLTVQELRKRKAVLVKGINNNLLTEKLKNDVKKQIERIDKRIADLK